MSTPIAAELREYALQAVKRDDYMGGLTYDLDRIADRIDAEHRRRMDDSRRETRHATIRYLRGVLTDYDKGVKRVRKGDAVEVVRCTDCRWAREVEPVDGWRLVCRVMPLMQHYVRDDGYCDHGEKAEVDDG